MRQPNAPNPGVAGPSNHFHRLPPIPTGARHELPVPPPMRKIHTGPPPPPPVPARPGQPDLATRPFSAQGITSRNVETTPFPVPPPPPPIPPRIGQGGPSLSPTHAHPSGDVYGSFQNPGLHRPTSQLNLNASGSHSNEPWHSDASLQAQRRAQKDEEDRKAAEELRLEKERLRMEQEELHRQALALERLRKEEHERQIAAMEKIRKEQEDLARLKAIAKEEEERRLQRERWAEEERVRRAKWEEEERIKRELEREQWRAEEEERNRRLRMEMADERFAAVFSLKEEMEAERLKQEAEEKRKAAEKAAEAEIARLKEEEERERQARLLQEKKDAEMARKLETTEEEDDQPSVNATTSHPSSMVQTPQQRIIPDLPGYDQLQRPQVDVPPPSFEPQAINEPGDVHAPHMGRPHANTTANISQPPVHLLPHNQSFPRLPAGMVNSNVSSGSSPGHYNMAMPPEHAQNPPAPIHAPTQHTGFPNAGTGQGPPYHNHFFPHREAENSPISPPGGAAPHRTGPNKLQRPSNSVGGGNPTGRPPAHNNNGNPRPGTLVMPHPGHVAVSPSLPSITPPSSGRPSTANPPFATTPTELHSSPGAGGSGQPAAPTPNSEPSGHIINEYPHGNASQQPIEPLSGIIHGFGRPALRDHDLPAATPVPDVITLEPEPSPPYFIVAHTWKHLVKFIASQNIAIIEPSPAALAREKHGPPNLRVVLHFAKIPRGDYRIVLYFAIQSITPPPQDYPSYDTSVPPYLFPSPDPGRPLANLPEAQVYTIPTKPLPVLPMKVPNLAPYLTAALDESHRHHDSRSRLAKLVNAVNSAVNAPPSVVQYVMNGITGSSSRPDQEMQGGPVKAVETTSTQKASFISRIFRPKAGGSKGKGLNNDMYDVVTPFNAADYH